MAELTFKTLSFELKENELQVNLLRIFYAKIPIEELNQVGPFKLIDQHTLEFTDTYQEKAEMKFSYLLSKHFDNLKNSINGNKTVYVHQNSGIPLMGNVSFGIVYRNTSLIEIKPVTSCNLNCIYCSVGEGKKSKKTDFVVEKDYLIEELERLLKVVKEPVEIHIGVQGEPFLYADLIPLVEDLYNNKQVTVISMDSNFTLVTKSQMDTLFQFKDKLRFNVSLDAMNQELAEKLAGCKYNLNYVLEMIKYAVKKEINILIAPVFIPGYNDEELEKITEFVKELGLEAKSKHPVLGIQNFLNYKTGRNPVRAKDWQEFYKTINELECKVGLKQKLSATDFGIKKTIELDKPFQMGDEVKAMVKSVDRFPNSVIAVAKNRSISVPECRFKKDKKIRIKITRDKHNVFAGKIL
ncbi:radical SAM protein [Candidatus Woesearchaeota archaeon]|nr:radical SAM protein [Candidatus Woesearchaeota archaeon]